MNLEDRLMRLMREPDYVPVTFSELSHALSLNNKENKRFRKLVQDLLRNGTIARVKGDRYCIAQDADLTSGTILFRHSGSAFLIPDDPVELGYDSVEIRSDKTGVALHKDHVLVRIKRPQQKTKVKRGRRYVLDENDGRLYGRVIRILERKNKQIIGTLNRSRMFYHVIPDDPLISRNIIVPPPEEAKTDKKPKVNDKVIVKLLEWEQAHVNPEGEIVEILGKTHSPMAEYKAILSKFHLNPEFPDQVIKEVKSIPEKVTAKDIGNRRDYRDIFTLTIDPDDAKDFDDALSIEMFPNGNIRVGVHIADVNAYVTPGSALDKEASRRGNSTYLVGTVIPMLPHALSNGICSLVEAEDRLTKTVFMTWNKQGLLKDTDFANCVIRSNKRLTYKQAYNLLIEDDLDKARTTPMPESHNTGSIGKNLADLPDEELRELQSAVRNLWSIAGELRRARFKKGSLDLDMPDIKIYVDKEGYADRIENVHYDESHQLIEEFMLIANECIAKTIHESGMPLISRVHDDPDEEKLNDLREYLLASGIQTGNLMNRREVTKLLSILKEHPDSYLLKIQFLRSLKQACYRAEKDGHYGLNKTYYTHFTSPIRRYSDLIIHRLFDHYLQRTGNPSASDAKATVYSKAKLTSMASHLSITEQSSTEAERESVKIKLLEYFEREAKKEHKTSFTAIITDVKNRGIFIELTESQAYGMIPLSTLRDDLYKLSMDRRSVQGRRRKKTYSIGQRIKVHIGSVDRFSRHIDFLMADQKEISDKNEKYQVSREQLKGRGRKPHKKKRRRR